VGQVDGKKRTSRRRFWWAALATARVALEEESLALREIIAKS
jgi:hypothetical protein